MKRLEDVVQELAKRWAERNEAVEVEKTLCYRTGAVATEEEVIKMLGGSPVAPIPSTMLTKVMFEVARTVQEDSSTVKHCVTQWRDGVLVTSAYVTK